MSAFKLITAAAIASTLTAPVLADSHKVISTADIEWGMLNPARGDASPKAADLWGDRTKDMATGMLVKFEKGFSSPPHIHNITYRGVVIEGLMHNDDKHADKLWLPAGSFWTQPAGESHITAANGEDNLIYLEIDSGPYLVQPEDHAFDNGERPINVAENNVVWLNANDANWLNAGSAQMAYLWGNPEHNNGTFLKLPANFEGYINADADLKAVVVKGQASYRFGNDSSVTKLSPSSFFSSEGAANHRLTTKGEVVLYVKSHGSYLVK